MQQLRLAARSLMRAPAFAATAILALTLGIGLSTAVFTIANALLVRRLPVADQDRLVLLWGEAPNARTSNVPLTLDGIRDLERRSQALKGVAFFEFRGAVPAPIQVDGNVYPIRVGMVSGNFFNVLGSNAIIGRALRPEDDVAGAAPVIALSYHAWQQRFGGDSTIIGRSVRMIYTGRSYTVVGVMPQGLDYPRGTDVWVPLVAYGSAGGFLDALTGELDVLARLKPGATAPQARAEMSEYFGRADAPAWQRGVRGVARPLADVMLGDTKPAVVLVALAAALLLLLSCANVANLLLVRSLGRIKEMAVRSALGASRGRITAQVLAECGLLAMAGGLLGTSLAAAAVRVFIGVAPASVPRVDEISVSGATLVAALITTVVAMSLSGLASMRFASRVNASDVLRSGSRQSGGRRVRKLAESLVVAQIALATVSLTAAGLVTRSFIKLQTMGVVFEPEHLLAVTLVMRPDQLGDDLKQRRALEMALTAAEALPGVRGVTPVFTVPFVGEGGGIDGRVAAPEQSAEERAGNPVVNLEVVAPNYFAMLGIPVLRGRSFTDGDRQGSAPVIVISSAVARHFWPDSDPIGKQLVASRQSFTVAGIVPDTRYRELETAWPTVYFPLAHSPLPVPSTLIIRAGGAPASLVPAVRHAVSEIPGLAVLNAAPFGTLLDAPRAQPRLNAMVIALFAAAAILLAAIGLLAVIATMVRQRTREFGIRMALGATSGRVRGMIMLRGLSLATAGAAIGTAGALAAGRALSALLFEISPTDTATCFGVAALVLGVAAIASFLPAQRTMRSDPIMALRRED